MFINWKSKLYWLFCVWWCFEFFVVIYSQVIAKHVHVCGKMNHNKSTGELKPHNCQVPPNHECQWHIYPDIYNMNEVFLVFETFDLDSGDTSKVFEHGGELLFGPFSGNKSTFTILTGHLLLDVYVNTKSTPSSPRNFKAYFSALACYYEIDEESGKMSSPIYEDINRLYSVNCTWKFKIFKHVALKRLVIFDEFVLKDSFLIVQGSEAQDGIYTGTKKPPNVVALGNTTFELHLNTSISGENFNFTYSVKGNKENGTSNFVNKNTLCGEINRGGENGTLSPKNGEINAGRSCLWNVDCKDVPSVKEIFFSFEEFVLADNDSCEILDMGGNSLFGPFRGKKGQFSILTGVQSLKINLQISDNLPLFKRRFKTKYNAKVCVNEITGKVGTETCPLYKRKQRTNNNVSCSWLFHVSDDIVQGVSFDKFNIPGGQLYFMGNINPKQFYSGNAQPSDIFVKQTGNITLNFDTLTQNEFLFTYNEVTPECSAYIQLTEKNSFAWIISPSYQDYNSHEWINCQWIIQSPNSSVITFKIDKINLADIQDFVIIKDGNSRHSPVLLEITYHNQEAIKDNYLISTHNAMWILFNTQFLIKGSELQAKVNISKHGGYYRNNGSLTIHSPDLGNDIIYFLEVQSNQQVYITVAKENFFTSGIVEIYNDFSISASLLMTLRSGKYFYPIVSTGFKMMLVGKNFGRNSSVEINFKGIKKGCHKITLENNGVYTVAGNCNRTCSWIIPPKKNGKTLSFHFSSIALNPMDHIEIFQLDDKMSFVENIKYNRNRMPSVYLPASLGVYLNITRGICSTTSEVTTVFLSNFQTLTSCSSNISIQSGSKIEITSPNFPDTYPFRSHCHTNILRSNVRDFIYLSFKTFHLAYGHCVKVHDIANDKTFIYSNNNVNDLMTNSDIALELIARSCNSSEEFNSEIAVGNGYYADVFSTDCGGMFKSLEDSFSTPGFPDKMTGNSYCIWKIQIIEEKKNHTAYLIAFTIEWKYEERSVEVYDGPSLRSNVLTNLTGTIFSKTNSIIIMYRNNETQASAFTVRYQARVCSNLCDNGWCMHPDWPCNGINECGDYSDEKDCQGKTPLPPPVPPTTNIIKSGASPWIWTGVPVAFLLGVASVFIGAVILNKYRRRREEEGRYSIFPDLDQ